MTRFHTNEYMMFLRTATPDNLKQFNKQMLKCKCLHSFIGTAVIRIGYVISEKRLQSERAKVFFFFHLLFFNGTGEKFIK